ncbi:MAG: helix-turn-helix transcriptional regulator [Phycisphaerales bacterium]|nr:helix-turn-helix transcriptional regulator [Phycisphaerales bacterium]
MTTETSRATAIVDALETVSSLPAVPSRDWCERGAETLAKVITPKSRRAAFAVGVGSGTDKVERLETVAVHSQDQTAGLAIQQSLLRTPPICPRRDGRSELAAVTSAELSRSDSWLRSPLMKVVASHGMIGLVLGVGLITSAEPGRLLWIFGAAEAASESAIIGDLSFIMVLLLALVRRSQLALGGDPAQPIEWISDRERETLEHIVRGQSVREIAEETGKSAHTIHDHVKSLHRKLGASSRGELVARALGHLPPLRQESQA